MCYIVQCLGNTRDTNSYQIKLVKGNIFYDRITTSADCSSTSSSPAPTTKTEYYQPISNRDRTAAIYANLSNAASSLQNSANRSNEFHTTAAGANYRKATNCFRFSVYS